MHKTAYDMRISDWSSDVCASDLRGIAASRAPVAFDPRHRARSDDHHRQRRHHRVAERGRAIAVRLCGNRHRRVRCLDAAQIGVGRRSEEHTSELQSLMRISYAVFCLKKKKKENEKT